MLCTPGTDAALLTVVVCHINFPRSLCGKLPGAKDITSSESLNLITRTKLLHLSQLNSDTCNSNETQRENQSYIIPLHWMRAFQQPHKHVSIWNLNIL